jgi:hypothetical protein
VKDILRNVSKVIGFVAMMVAISASLSTAKGVIIFVGSMFVGLVCDVARDFLGEDSANITSWPYDDAW